MYHNIGDKVCTLAKFCGLIGIIVAIAGVLCFCVAFETSEDVLFIVSPILIAVGIVCVIGSWPLYAFGQITNDVHEMRMNTSVNVSAMQFTDLPEL